MLPYVFHCIPNEYVFSDHTSIHQFLVTDAIVIWRTWVLWKDSYAKYTPILFWIASLGELSQISEAAVDFSFSSPMMKGWLSLNVYPHSSLEEKLPSASKDSPNDHSH